MTVIAQRRDESPSGDQHADPDAEAPESPPVRSETPALDERRQRARVVALVLLSFAVVVLAFVGYLFGLSRLSEQRSQNTMYKTFARQLSQATAPVGTSSAGVPITVGTPVAIVDVAAIGLRHLVVVEGTTARQLTRGPGHRRDTPLPGQAGVSVIYGRRATFGGPFANIPSLPLGARISVTTGQGVSTYVVHAHGTSARPPHDTAANRLLLVTADSAFTPSSTVSVSADLVSPVQPSTGVLPTLSPSERSLAGAQAQSVLPLMLWGQALIIVAVVGTVAVRRWSKWPAYMCFAPLALAVLWNVFENAATLLPNVW